MRIVLLGATGFVGHHLLPELSAAGHQCLVLCRYKMGCRELALIPEVELRQVDDLNSSLNYFNYFNYFDSLNYFKLSKYSFIKTCSVGHLSALQCIVASFGGRSGLRPGQARSVPSSEGRGC